MFSEIGSPVGFQMVKFIRDILINEDVPGKVIAPCPHQFSCPMKEKSWCHIKQRTFLLAHERKTTTKSFRDVPFSYIVVQKPSVLGESADLNERDQTFADVKSVEEAPWSRIVRQPRKRGGHIHLDLCTPKGKIKETIITRRHGTDFYASARKAKWGDGFVDPRPDEASNEAIPEEDGGEQTALEDDSDEEKFLKE